MCIGSSYLNEFAETLIPSVLRAVWLPCGRQLKSLSLSLLTTSSLIFLPQCTIHILLFLICHNEDKIRKRRQLICLQDSLWMGLPRRWTSPLCRCSAQLFPSRIAALVSLLLGVLAAGSSQLSPSVGFAFLWRESFHSRSLSSRTHYMH